MSFSLVGSVFIWVVVLIALALMIASLFPLNRHRITLIGIVAAVSLLITVVALHFATKAGWIVPALPWNTQPWIWAAVFALVWVGVGWRSGRVRSRVLAGAAAPVSILMALVLFNAYFNYLPTFGDVVGHAPTDRANAYQIHNASQWVHRRPGPSEVNPIVDQLRTSQHGLVLPVTFASSISRFQARPGWVYLPPAWWGPDRANLPVIELFGGTPSSPIEWLRGANAQGAADRFAQTHNGYAPVLAMVDDNGSFSGDTECVDRPGMRAETYAVVDVRATMIHRFGVGADPRKWAVAGLSEGGMCALALGLRHPDAYRVIGDFGGEPTQALDNPQDTLRVLFGGNRALQSSYDPNTLMRTRRYHGLWAMFVSGRADGNLRSLKTQAVAAQHAGMNVEMHVVPGGHTYYVWSAGLERFIPFVWRALNPNLAATNAQGRPPGTRSPTESYGSTRRIG